MDKPIRYLSVCSGMEAATVAWHPLGWTPVPVMRWIGERIQKHIDVTLNK
jgi:site-specific DNA-cytosine methylase